MSSSINLLYPSIVIPSTEETSADAPKPSVPVLSKKITSCTWYDVPGFSITNPSIWADSNFVVVSTSMSTLDSAETVGK